MAKRNQQTTAREGAQLDGQLSAYSVAARLSAAAGSLHRRVGNWPIYAAATGSALAMATGASASIIYSGPQNIFATAPGSNVASIVSIPLDPPVSHRLNIVASTGLIYASAFGIVSAQAQSHVKVFDIAGKSQLMNFAAGSMISSNAGDKRPQGVIAGFFTGASFGAFQPNVPGFAGLVIQTGAATEYGWIQLEFFKGQNDLPSTLEAIDWAIETNGDPIAAGATPEPGTMALALLASGAAGIIGWKRRRRPVVAAPRP